MSGSGGQLDLFGAPLRPERPRGRPLHAVNAASQLLVIRMRQAGASVAAIAATLRITAPTLWLDYAVELATRRKPRPVNALRPHGRGGRKPHIPIPASRDTVARLRAEGASVGQIARALKIGTKALRREYDLAQLPGTDRHRHGKFLPRRSDDG